MTTLLLVAVVAGSSILYQKLGMEHVGSGNLLTDSDAISRQLGASDQANSENTPISPSPQNQDSASENDEVDVSPIEENEEPSPAPEENDNREKEQPVNQEEDSPEAPPKNLAPDFTVLDENGNEVKLSDFRGKPVVLNFWTTWCYYCRYEMPDFNEAYKKYPEIQFLMVNVTDGVSETVEKAKKFKKDNGYDFEIFFDVKAEGEAAYNVNSYPATYFINAEGQVVATVRGMLNASILKQGIANILPSKKEDF